MSKKSFRATKRSDSDYPKLADVDAGMLRKLGLIAIGGLALGSAGCRGNAAVAGAIRADVAMDGGTAHSAPGRTPDKKEPTAPITLPPPGAPPPARIDPVPEPQPLKAKAKATSSKKAEKIQHRMMGKIRPPRLDPTN